MISDAMVKGLNHQINRELYSAYLYRAMAAYVADAGMSGAANWFEIQAKEEVSHAERFYSYVLQQGGRVVFDAIEAPPRDYDSVVSVFEETLKHEKVVTGLINELVALAQEEKDNATQIFLQWFVSEQVEEEASAAELVQKLKLVGNNGSGLYMVDKELAARVFTPPVSEGS